MARIIPIEEGVNLKFEELDLLGQRPTGNWAEMKLNTIQVSSKSAIDAIIKDRDD